MEIKEEKNIITIICKCVLFISQWMLGSLLIVIGYDVWKLNLHIPMQSLLKLWVWSQPMVRIRVMVFNATFNNISVMSWVSFIGGGKQTTRRKPPICHKSLTNFITLYTYCYSSFLHKKYNSNIFESDFQQP